MIINIIASEFANLHSVQNALEVLEFDSVLSKTPEGLEEASLILFPGVGSFQTVKAKCDSLGLSEAIQLHIQKGNPFLGICLGMQILFEKSDEGSEHNKCEGLGVFEGEVKEIPKDKVSRIPHIGWNSLIVKDSESNFREFNEKQVYFVHSFYCQAKEKSIISKCNLGENFSFPAIVRSENTIAFQFHPEKSGKIGLHILNSAIKELLP